MIDKSLIKNKIPIDVVIPWVDGSDSNHKEKRSLYLDNNDIKKIPGAHNTRFASINEIKYSILSILKFAPFVRNIFIVTDSQNPNIEKYIKDLFPGRLNSIRIVDHKEIFEGFKQFLPTFNSRTIDRLLWRIKGLSNHYVYLNDDIFLIRNVKPEDWFCNGRPVMRGSWKLRPWLRILGNECFKYIKKKISKYNTMDLNPSFYLSQWWSAEILGFKFRFFRSEHTPHPVDMNRLKNYFNRYNNVFLKDLEIKFRHYNQYNTVALANHLEISEGNIFFAPIESIYFKPVNRHQNYISKKIKLCAENKSIKFICLQSLDLAKKKDQEKIFNWMDDILSL